MLRPFKCVTRRTKRCPFKVSKQRLIYVCCTAGSNASTIENRLDHLFCLEEFAGNVVSGARMVSVVAIDFFYCVNNFPDGSEG